MLTERCIIMNSNRYDLDSLPPWGCVGRFGFMSNLGCYGFIPNDKRFWPDGDIEFYVVDPADLLKLDGLPLKTIKIMQKFVEYLRHASNTFKETDRDMAERISSIAADIEASLQPLQS